MVSREAATEEPTSDGLELVEKRWVSRREAKQFVDALVLGNHDKLMSGL